MTYKGFGSIRIHANFIRLLAFVLLVTAVLAIPVGGSTAHAAANRTLKFGMRGSDVVQLQNALKEQGFFWANSTGYYGKITERAVINYQIANKLRIDGIAGPQTLGSIFGKTSAKATTVSRSNSTKARDDIFWLARIIQAEAGGEPYKGKVAVGNVVMNRLYSPLFPNTIYNVIFEYSYGVPQFSPVANGSIYNSPNSECLKAAEEAYYGSKPAGSALYFFNPKKASGSWIVRNRKYMTTIGNHAFYH